MPDCDGFFDAQGIPYDPSFESDAVFTAWHELGEHPAYAKEMILCWFDVTYGEWNGTRYDLRDSRARMSQYLTRNGFQSFEQLLSQPTLNGRNRT